jgi:Na+-driven multidrug efflux pump
VTNIVLDYIFVIRLSWGVAGAAWATGIAQVISLVIFLLYFYSKRSHLKIGPFQPQPRAFLRIFPLGVADCSVELIVAFLTLIYNQILLRLFGESSLTIYAVVAYLNLFVFMIMQGVAQGMMHLVSLYIGKGEEAIASGYMKLCLLTSLALSLLFVGLCQVSPDLIAGLLLSRDSELFAGAVAALRQFSLSFPFVGLNIAIAGYLTAKELPIPSISLALSRGFVFAPLALLFCAFLFGGQLLWLAALLGELSCFLVSILVLRRVGRKAQPLKAAHE